MNTRIKLYLEGQDDDAEIIALVNHAIELVFGLYLLCYKCGPETLSVNTEYLDDKNDTAIVSFTFNNIAPDETNQMYQLATGNLIHKEVQSYQHIYEYIKNISFEEI